MSIKFSAQLDCWKEAKNCADTVCITIQSCLMVWANWRRSVSSVSVCLQSVSLKALAYYSRWRFWQKQKRTLVAFYFFLWLYQPSHQGQLHSTSRTITQSVFISSDFFSYTLMHHHYHWTLSHSYFVLVDPFTLQCVWWSLDWQGAHRHLFYFFFTDQSVHWSGPTFSTKHTVYFYSFMR